MTCIAAFRNKDILVIGGDSIICEDTTIQTLQPSKVYRVGDFIIGDCGSVRAGNLMMFDLEHRLETPPKTLKNLRRYMVTHFIDAMRDMLDDAGAKTKQNGMESISDNTFIVGVHGRLFSIDSDFGIVETKDPYMACGIGMDYALGGMYTALMYTDDPKEIVMAGLKAAAKHSALVDGPYNILTSVNNEEFICSE